jgi:hypothetical protein
MKLLELRNVALFVGVAATASMIAAPTASAAGTWPDCNHVSIAINTRCQSPGDVQINNSGQIQFAPPSTYWSSGYWVGDRGGGYR